MYKFGRTSQSRLATCHPVLQLIMGRAIKTAPHDFGIVCGFRGKQEQSTAFADGKSNAEWGESDHNYLCGDNPCSLAIDFAPYSQEISDYLWDDEDKYIEIVEHIKKTAADLGYKIEWGGNYTTIKDLPHVSLRFS